MALRGAARLSRGSPTRRRELGAKPALAAAARDPRSADAGHSDQRAPQTALPSHQEVAAPRRPLIGCGGQPRRSLGGPTCLGALGPRPPPWGRRLMVATPPGPAWLGI